MTDVFRALAFMALGLAGGLLLAHLLAMVWGAVA